MSRTVRRILIVAGILVLLVFAASCTSSGSSTPGNTGSQSSAPSAAAPGPNSSSPVSPSMMTPHSSAPSAPSVAAPSSSAPVTQSPTPASTLKPVHNPGQVTGTLTGPCHTRDNGQLPDSRCTPGSYDPSVTQANLSTTLCVKHVSSTGVVNYDLSAAWKAGRPPVTQTNHAKFYVVDPAYGILVSVKGELDHLDAREIGGSNDLSNLWLQSGPIPNPKDAVENATHDAVCSGQMTLAAAQTAMATNWVQLGQQLGVK